MPTLVQLPAGKALTVRTAADLFLDSLGNPNRGIAEVSPKGAMG